MQAPEIKRLAHLEGDALLEAARATSIYQHTIIAAPVFRAIPYLAPYMANYDRERSFRAHAIKLFQVYHSIREGWDTRKQRLIYAQVANPTTTTAGHIVPADGLFLTNGQHRTAALMALGYTELPDYMAGIRVPPAGFLPLDLTEAYVKAGICTEEKFVEFARFRFPAIPEEIAWVDGLFEWAYTHALDWLCDYIKIYWRQK